jgi:diaminopimelate epimerase
MKSVPRAIPFFKGTACGNDFLIIEGSYATGDVAAFSRRMCDRQHGIGADGVEWLYSTADADVEARLINADGSPAEISGNGTRCVAAYLAWKNNQERISVRTGAGLKENRLTNRSGNLFEFETAMGTPMLEPEIPLVLPTGVVRGMPVSMGNPHYAVFVDMIGHNWKEEAAEIGRHTHFPNGVNVEFIVVEDQARIRVWFYERGVGETLSSGTGSCASAVAAIHKRLATSPVEVCAAGGKQTVHWNGEVLLRGKAELICHGEFFA